MRTISTKIRLSAGDDVQISDAYLAKNDTGFALVIDIINNTYQSIVFLKLDVMFSNAFGKFIFDETVFQHEFKALDLRPKSLSYLPYWMLDERHQTARGVRIRIAEVHFENGTRKYYDRTKEHIQTVPILSKKEKDQLKKLYGPDFYTYAGRYNGMWRCICGFTNKDDEEICRYCKRSKDFVLSAVTERQVNKKLFELYTDVEDDEDFLPFSNMTMPIRPLDEIELERNAPQDVPKSSKKQRLAIFILAAVGLIAMTSFALTLYANKRVRDNYQRAEDYIAMGNYEAASQIYDSLPPTVDNIDMALKIEELESLKESDRHYKKGLELNRAGDLLGAYANYTKVIESDNQNYLNAQAMMRSIEDDHFRHAADLLRENKKDEARALIEALIRLNPINDALVQKRDRLFTR